MKALFNIRDYKNIDIIPEISYSDVMDGTPDTMTFSFIHPTDLVLDLQLKETCYVTIEDTMCPLIETDNTINFETSTIAINDNVYTIQRDNIYSGTDAVGYILRNRQEVYILDIKYYYYNETQVENKTLYLDNRLYYNMCLSQISSELLSTNSDNGFLITVNLKEQTMLLKDCIKTDIAITPDLYPITKDENGNDVKIYDNMLDAVSKICDKHNMQLLNYKIIEIEYGLQQALKELSCPTLTYKDLSTFDQLYDIFVRVGRVPYFEEGTLYGIELNGTNSEYYNILNFGLYNDNVNDELYCSFSDNTLTVNGEVPAGQGWYSPSVPLQNPIPAGSYYYAYEEKNFNFVVVAEVDGNIEQIELTEQKGELLLNGKAVIIYAKINEGTYSNVSSSLLLSKKEPILNQSTILTNSSSLSRVRTDGVNQNVYDTKVYNTLYDNEYTIVPTLLSTKINEPSVAFSSITKGSKSVSEINTWLVSEYQKWTTLNSPDKIEAKRLLGVSNYNARSAGVQDSRAYGLTLPCNIERISRVFVCKPFVLYDNSNDTVNFGFTKTFPELNIYLNGTLATSVEKSNTFRLNDTNISMTTLLDDKGFGTLYTNYIYVEDGEFYINGVTYTILVEPTNNSTGIVETYGNRYIVDMSGAITIGDYTYNIHFPLSSGNGIVTRQVSWELPVNNYEFQLYDKKYTIDTGSRILEYQYYKNLEQLQQNIFAYYQRGTNTINQIVSLIASKTDLQGSLPLSDARLYDALKSCYFVVEYKPMLDQKFTNYDYNLVSDGKELEPNDVKSYNLPYKAVTDRQVYPLLEYDLSKGTDKNTNIKCVFNDARLLLLQAGNTVTLNGNKYIISSLSHYINNNSVETALELNSNVVSQSTISSYRDSVRVSDNLSTETEVNSDINIYSEEIVTLENSISFKEIYLDELTADNSYFTQLLGKELIKGTYNALGMYEYNLLDKPIYYFMSSFPLRFSKLVQPELPSSKYFIKVYSETPYGSGIFEFNEFPIYARGIRSMGDEFTKVRGPVVTIHSLQELIAYNNSSRLYVLALFKSFNSPLYYEYSAFSTDNSTWVELRPELYKNENQRANNLFAKYYGKAEGWNFVRYNPFGGENYDNTHNSYEINQQYTGNELSLDTEQIYTTEGMFTNSQFITNYVYLINDPSNVLTRYTTASVPALTARGAITTPNVIKEWDANFERTDPIYYNTSNYGCKLSGFGPTNDNRYNLSILQTYSQKSHGKILDLRETPQVHLQYKTLMRNSEYYELLELSKDFNWLRQVTDLNAININNLSIRIIAFKEGLSLKDVDINYQNYNYNNFTFGMPTLTSFDRSFGFYLNYADTNKFVKNNGKQFGLILVNNEEQTVTKLCRFKLLKDNPRAISINLNIKNSYSSLTHFNKITDVISSSLSPIPYNTNTTIFSKQIGSEYNTEKESKILITLYGITDYDISFGTVQLPINYTSSNAEYVDVVLTPYFVNVQVNVPVKMKCYFEPNETPTAENIGTIKIDALSTEIQTTIDLTSAFYIVYQEVE